MKTIAISVAPLPFAALVQRYPRRALLSIVSAFLWSAVAISTGYVTLIWGLLLVLLLDGLTTASVGSASRMTRSASRPGSIAPSTGVVLRSSFAFSKSAFAAAIA